MEPKEFSLATLPSSGDDDVAACPIPMAAEYLGAATAKMSLAMDVKQKLASAELTEELASLGTDLQETTVRTIVFVIKPNSIIVFS